MVRRYLNYLYKVFVFSLILGLVLVDLPRWPVWPKSWVPPYSQPIETKFANAYNDPLFKGYGFPNGWFAGIYFWEQLHWPFLFYYLFGKGKFHSYFHG
jgi:hypothetical protein